MSSEHGVLLSMTILTLSHQSVGPLSRRLTQGSMFGREACTVLDTILCVVQGSDCRVTD